MTNLSKSIKKRSRSTRRLRFGLINAQNLLSYTRRTSSNAVIFSAHDVYIATETWLTDQITNLELYLPNYNIFRADRKTVGETSSHGGILIATKPYVA